MVIYKITVVIYPSLSTTTGSPLPDQPLSPQQPPEIMWIVTFYFLTLYLS